MCSGVDVLIIALTVVCCFDHHIGPVVLDTLVSVLFGNQKLYATSENTRYAHYWYEQSPVLYIILYICMWIERNSLYHEVWLNQTSGDTENSVECV